MDTEIVIDLTADDSDDNYVSDEKLSDDEGLKPADIYSSSYQASSISCSHKTTSTTEHEISKTSMSLASQAAGPSHYDVSTSESDEEEVAPATEWRDDDDFGWPPATEASPADSVDATDVQGNLSPVHSSADEIEGAGNVSPAPSLQNSEDDFDMQQSSQNSYRAFHPLSDSDSETGPEDKKAKGPITTKKTKSVLPKAATKRASDVNVSVTNKRKKRTREEIEAVNAEKEKRKLEREKARRLKPGECLKYIIMEVDSSIVEIPELQAVLLDAPIKDIRNRVCSRSQPYTVGWVREKVDDSEERLDLVVQLLTMDYLEIILEQNNDLVGHISDLLRNLPQPCKLGFIILGSQQYFRAKMGKGKKKQTHGLTKHKLDEAIVFAELELKITFRLIETAHELSEWLYRYSRAIGEREHKLAKKGWQDRFRFHIASEKMKNIRMGTKPSDSLPHVWLNMLKKLRRTTPEICEAIVTKYPTPTSLMTAYEECSNEAEGKSLLQNIIVQRSTGPLAVQRNIGPVISRKLYTLFTSQDPNKKLADS